MKSSRRTLLRENTSLRQKLEECQALLSTLAQLQGGTLIVPADALQHFSVSVEVEHLFAIRRCENGDIRVEFTPTAPPDLEMTVVDEPEAQTC